MEICNIIVTEKQDAYKTIEKLNENFHSLKEILMSVPTVESHYNQKFSTKPNLEPTWISKIKMHMHYSAIW